MCACKSDRHFGYYRLFSFHYFNIIFVVVFILTASAAFIARGPVRFSSSKTVFFPTYRFFFFYGRPLSEVLRRFPVIERRQFSAYFLIILSFGFPNRRCSSFTMRAFPILRRSTFLFLFFRFAHISFSSTVSGGCGWGAVLFVYYVKKKNRDIILLPEIRKCRVSKPVYEPLN